MHMYKKQKKLNQQLNNTYIPFALMGLTRYISFNYSTKQL